MKVDPDRWRQPETGIFVRAQNLQGSWVSVDIAYLYKKDIVEWMRLKGPEFAQNLVLILLNHEPQP